MNTPSSQNIANANKLKVFCRVRTSSQQNDSRLYKINDSKHSIELENKTIYSFHKIFKNSSQKEIFQTILLPNINEALVNSMLF